MKYSHFMQMAFSIASHLCKTMIRLRILYFQGNPISKDFGNVMVPIKVLVGVFLFFYSTLVCPHILQNKMVILYAMTYDLISAVNLNRSTISKVTNDSIHVVA